MGLSEIFFGSLLALALLGLAGYFCWQQQNNQNLLRSQLDLSPEDRQYLKGQVRRRLWCSVLMVILAGQLVGWIFMDDKLRQLQEVPLAGQEVEPAQQAEAREAIRLFVFYWIGALLVLLGVLTLAALDFMATARFGLAKQRELSEARRAMLEMEASRLRRESNGHK